MAAKHPELAIILDKLTVERDEILEKVKPLRAERDKLVEEIAPIELKLRAVNDQIDEIERPRLKELHEQILALEKAMK
jgi:uncharacterized coiled-coil DUF342 family protein